MTTVVLDCAVQGASHKVRGVECQDAAGSWASLDKSRYVAVVADGHGDPTSIRSAIGARLAVEVALERLHALPRHLSVSQKQLLSQVGQEIVREWTRRVRQDLEDYPIEQSEFEGLDPQLISSWLHANPAHLYGTTLVGMLLMPDACVYVQQGDGSCILVGSDGLAMSPMPPDEQCVGPITTSLCDVDAAERIRVRVVDLRGRSVAGSFVTSDGIVNSFPKEEGIYAFFKHIILAAQDKDRASMQCELPAILTKTSTNGSQDDVSVAGVVCTDLPDDAAGELQRAVQAYELRFEVQQARSKLISMQRKHDILQKRAAEGRSDQVEEYLRYHEEYVGWETRLKEATTKLSSMGISTLDLD